jgi:hypothetical protein
VRRALEAAVVIGALVWAGSRGPATVLEVLVVLGVLYGGTVTLGGLVGRSTGGRRRTGRGCVDPAAVVAVGRVLDGLDRIEHRRVDLGRPWPAVVVGPTGVHLVGICSCCHEVARRPAAAGVRLARPPEAPCATCARGPRLTEHIRRAVADLDGSRPIPVRTLLVVPGSRPRPGGAASPGADEHGLVVAPEQLHDALVRGPVLPMAAVDQAYGALRSLVTFGLAVRR